MPLPIPNLDDRTYDQLAAEARALIPRYAPAWTDHNPSDPGITLLEMFAHLFEASLYQIDRVPDRTLSHFALLVGGKEASDTGPLEALRSAVEGLHATHLRAVTPAEIENAVAAPDSDLKVKRAKVVMEVRNRPNIFPAETITHVVTIPNVSDLTEPPGEDENEERMQKYQAEVRAYCASVFRYLRPRLLITSRLKVSIAQQDTVSLSVTAVRDSRAQIDPLTLQTQITKRLTDYLDPIIGGADGAGWEFGRPVFRSELYQIIKSVAGVEYVRRLTLKGSWQFGFGDLTDPIALATKLTETGVAEKQVAYLRGQLSQEQQEALRLANAIRPVTSELRKTLTDSLNQLLETPNLWKKEIFGLMGPENTHLDTLRKYNRKLIEDAFPQELARIPEDADARRGELPLLTPFSVIKPLHPDTLRVEVVDA